jgi:hypothetical protein
MSRSFVASSWSSVDTPGTMVPRLYYQSLLLLPTGVLISASAADGDDDLHNEFDPE